MTGLSTAPDGVAGPSARPRQPLSPHALKMQVISAGWDASKEPWEWTRDEVHGKSVPFQFVGIVVPLLARAVVTYERHAAGRLARVYGNETGLHPDDCVPGNRDPVA